MSCVSVCVCVCVVFSEEEDHSYSHHEVLLTSFPLALEWLDYDPEQPEQKGKRWKDLRMVHANTQEKWGVHEY